MTMANHNPGKDSLGHFECLPQYLFFEFFAQFPMANLLKLRQLSRGFRCQIDFYLQQTLGTLTLNEMSAIVHRLRFEIKDPDSIQIKLLTDIYQLLVKAIASLKVDYQVLYPDDPFLSIVAKLSSPEHPLQSFQIIFRDFVDWLKTAQRWLIFPGFAEEKRITFTRLLEIISICTHQKQRNEQGIPLLINVPAEMIDPNVELNLIVAIHCGLITSEQIAKAVKEFPDFLKIAKSLRSLCALGLGFGYSECVDPPIYYDGANPSTNRPMSPWKNYFLRLRALKAGLLGDAVKLNDTDILRAIIRDPRRIQLVNAGFKSALIAQLAADKLDVFTNNTSVAFRKFVNGLTSEQFTKLMSLPGEQLIRELEGTSSIVTVQNLRAMF
jgi:hypothetical protein